MIDKFLQIKQQVSSWPSERTNEQERLNYIQAFLDRDGVLLEYEEIAKNLSLRSLAKLILNSFWGKFGERMNQDRTSIMLEPDELFRLENNPSINLTHLTEINESVLIASWKYKDEAVVSLDTVNVVIASFVTPS